MYDKIMKYLELVTKITTIGLFFLALFGYIYTVKPKFFLDNLKIKMEILENKNIKLINSIKEKEEKIKFLNIDIKSKVKEKNKSLNERKYILWETFFTLLKISTVHKEKKYNARNEYIIYNTKQDKLFLNNNSPYLLLNKYFSNLEYSKKFFLINEKEFKEFKNFILNNIEEERLELEYEVNLKELNLFRKKCNIKITKYKSKIYKINYSSKDIVLDKIKKIHINYDDRIKVRYNKVKEKINYFIKKISLKYIKMLKLKIKPKTKISIDNRSYSYGEFNIHERVFKDMRMLVDSNMTTQP